MVAAVVASSPNISGNVGQCKINTSANPVSSFYTETFSINSCTGQIVQQNTYYDWTYVYIPGLIIFSVVFIIGSIVSLIRYLDSR